MKTKDPSKPRVFIDADVLFAASASPSTHAASLVILKMAEITLINAITSKQVITEVERNLTSKFPEALVRFQLLIQRTLQIVPDPDRELLKKYAGMADPKDLPILAAAKREGCAILVTFNVRHFQSGRNTVTVLQPSQFILKIRLQLSGM